MNVTIDDLDAIFKAEYSEDSEELKLWEEVKATNISDIESIEPAVVKRIKTQLKDYFFAEAFDEDNYDRSKLEELYDLLSKLSSLEMDDSSVEDVELDDVDSCVDAYSSHNKEGIKFFDERVSDTLSTKSFDYGTINVIVAPPGMGKTMTILNQNVYVASQGKHTLHLAIGDLTKRQVIIRLLAIITGNAMSAISMLSKEQFKSFLSKAKDKYKTVFDHLHCKCIMPNSLNGVEIVKLIEKTQEKLGVHFDQICVDYDGNIETSISTNKKNVDKTGKSMYYEGADIYNLLAAFAKRNETVVWVLSQPKIEYWGNEKLPLNSLADSSRKQHICDFIMSIGKKTAEIDEPKLTFFISKNRHGENNKTIFVQYDGASQVVTPQKDAWGDS